MSIFSKLIANQYYFDGGGYVRDGLTFMLDGIWNVKKNKHDSNATYIRNLVDGKKYTPVNFTDYEYSNNALVIKSNNTSQYTNLIPANITDVKTIELCLDFSNPNVQEIYTFLKIGAIHFATRVTTGSNKHCFFILMPTNSTTEQYEQIGRYYDVSEGFIIGNANTFLIKMDTPYDVNSYTFEYGNVNPIGYTGDDTKVNKSSDNSNFSHIVVKSLPNNIDVNIHAIRFYNRFLSDSEITNNCNLDKQRFNNVN